MNVIKLTSSSLFILLLFASNFYIIIEGLIVAIPIAKFEFFGNNSNNFMEDVNLGTVAISADKMNVFYIGIQNPITVAASGVAADNLIVAATGASIRKQASGQYIVNCTKPGQATLTVSNRLTGKERSLTFRVKRIPDPVMQLGGKTDGVIASGAFTAQMGLVARITNFDFDARCTVQSYTMYHTQKNEDPIELVGKGARFSGDILDVVKRAKPGDAYAFVNIKARCPGDIIGRHVNGLMFRIR
jgi:hypothetical protein